MVWETGVQSQVESYQRLIKKNLESVVAIEKGAFGSPSIMVM